MTDHLRPEEFVDALDDAAPAGAHEHLAACAECRAQFDELRDMMRASAHVEVPSPSPLFWDHFSERVRQATITLPTRAPWWESVWRPAAVFAAAASAVALVAILKPGAVAPITSPDPRATDAVAMAKVELPDDGSWGLVVAIASGYEYRDIKEATEPVSGTADAMIDDLTPAQRTALARLLEKEIGDQ